MRTLLSGGPFRWMWAGQTASLLGDGAQGVALAWLTLALTGSPLALGSVLLAGALPRAAVVLVGGAVSDRVSPRALLFASNVARALVAAVLAGLAATGSVRVWELYAGSFAFGLCDAFFVPAAGAVVPQLVAVDRDLTAANALLGVSEQGTMLVGPALGGVVVAAVGPGGAFGLNALSFLLAGAGLLPAPIRRTARTEAAEGVWAGIGAGLAYAWSRVDLRVLLMLISVESLTYNGVFGVGLPALARSLAQGPVALGLLYSSWGCGQLAGAVSAGLTGLPRRWGLLVIAMTAGAGLAFAMLGLLPALGPDAAVLAALGFGVAYSSDVALPTWVQRSTSPQLLGRVNGMIELPRSALAPVSVVAFGALAGTSLAAAFVACGAVQLLAAAAAARSRTVSSLVSAPEEGPSTLS
ncbi:MAG TPA: MFS transporter [Candidatus Dormibacteraeota bacterium]|nr:MFS transporter [Candidatus Dormibacteraeota bacterium]